MQCEESFLELNKKLTSALVCILPSTSESDLGLINQLVLINQGKEVDFMIDENDVMCFCGRVCVLDVPELKNSSLKKVIEVL